MTVKIKNSLIALLVLLFIFNGLLFLAMPQTANAEETENEIDYINQYYRDIPADFDLVYSDAVYKINCPDVREQLGLGTEEVEIRDYVTVISFRASMGYQIYFVNGVPCNLEDSRYGDYETDLYSDYYEIVAYDDANKNVYIKFKNLDELEYPEDFAIWNGDAVENAQYIYTSDIDKITEITNDMVFFSGDGPSVCFDPSCLSYKLKIREDVIFDSIEISFLVGGEDFSVLVSTYTMEDGLIQNGYREITIFANGDISTLDKKIKLAATVNYAGKTLTVESRETDTLTVWINLYNNNFVGGPTQTVLKEYITAHVRSYQKSFQKEVQALTFELFNEEQNKLKPSDLIFCFNANEMMSDGFEVIFRWGIPIFANTFETHLEEEIVIRHYGGYLYATARIFGYFNKDFDYLKVDEEYVGDYQFNYIDICVIEENLYIRINRGRFSELTSDFRIVQNPDHPIKVYANTSTVKYDEYNLGLLNEIETLKQQLAEVNKNLGNSNATIDELRGRINTLEQTISSLEETISNLEKAYNALEFKYNALNEKYVSALRENATLREEKTQAIENYMAEIEAHKTTKEMLEAQIATNEGDIASLQAQLDEVNATLAEKEEELKKAQEDLTALEKRYEELETEYQLFIEASDGDLQDLAGIIHDYKITVAQLEKQVAELQSQLEEEREKDDNKKTANGCSAGCNGSSGSGTGSGVGSTLTLTSLSMALFAGVVYAKRTRTKKE